MADDADNHSAIVARFDEIEAAKRLIKPIRIRSTHCIECGSKIPEARRLAIITDYCIVCQIRFEKR
jgi:RNA polymerase-binding transcription factor DksA